MGCTQATLPLKQSAPTNNHSLQQSINYLQHKNSQLKEQMQSLEARYEALQITQQENEQSLCEAQEAQEVLNEELFSLSEHYSSLLIDQSQDTILPEEDELSSLESLLHSQALYISDLTSQSTKNSKQLLKLIKYCFKD